MSSTELQTAYGVNSEEWDRASYAPQEQPTPWTDVMLRRAQNLLNFAWNSEQAVVLDVKVED